LGEDASTGYVQDLMKITGKWLKYTAVVPLEHRQGNVLYFKNGLRMDYGTKEAFLFIPSMKINGKLMSLFYLDQGQLIEKKSQGDALDASALVFEDQGIFYSVIADPKLIRSLLFRLYYLKGQGLSFFKPIISKGSLSGGTVIRVFELERNKFSI
jgi:hypothetical protein